MIPLIKTRLALIAASLIAAFGMIPAMAYSMASQNWSAGVNYNWDTTTANWSGASWTNGNDAIFGATGIGTVNLGAGITANSVTFSNTGYTISGGALTLTGAAAVTTNDGWAWIASAISGSNGLVVSGTGTLYLTAANTYTGATAIDAGTLYLNGSTATLGSGSSAVTLANVAGAQLETFWWNGTANVGTSFSIGSLSGGGANGGNVLLGAQATLTVGEDNTSTAYAGCISGVPGWGSGGIAKTGTGTLTLIGACIYTGTTTIAGGTLQIGDGTAGHDGSLASPSIVNNSNLVFNLSGTSAYQGAIAGSGTTTLKAGTLAVTGTIGIAGTFAPQAGSTLNFCLGGVGASGIIQLTGSYVAPISPVGITISDINYTLGSGTYNLITGVTGISTGDFVLNSVPPGYACALSASNGTLALAVVASASSPTMALGAAGTSGSAFSYQIALVNDPTGYGATGLPPGLSLNTSTGVISGTPSAPGTYFSNISSTCPAGAASSQLIIVAPPPPGTPLLTGSNSPQVLSDSGTALTVQPLLDNTLLINPGKGYVDYDPAPAASSGSFVDQYAGVGFTRVNWSDMEPTEGNIQWSVFDSLIAAYAQHGLKVSFGVINTNTGVPYATPQWVFQSGSNVQTGSNYPAGAVPMAVADFENPTGPQLIVPASWDDPVYLARMQEFIAALGAHYNANPNIADVQMLNYGVWGERNGAFAAGMTAATAADEANNYWEPYFQAFPNTQVNVSGNDAFALSKGAGTFICYIMSGTFSGVSNASSSLLFYPNHPIRMEYYGNCQQYYRGGALNELMIWITSGRPTYIPMDGDIYAANPNATAMIGNLIGYHFVLQQAIIPKTIQANVAFPLSFTWYNDGVAPITLSGTAPCNVAVALLDANNNPVQKQWLTTSNPKGWMPGISTTENFSVSFSSVPTDYKLTVGLFLNQSDANPAFKLGIQGRTSNGWYLLSGTVSQGAATWTNASGGSWQTSGNWTGGNYTNGIDACANFSTLDLTGDATVTLDGNVTVGSLVFGDTTPSNNWLLSGGTLTLRTSSGAPNITVNNQTTTIGVVVANNNGFTKSGSGTLVLSNTNDAIYGNITLNNGVLDITAGQLYNGCGGDGYGNNAVLTVNSGATLRLANWGQWWAGENLGMLDPGASSLVVNGGTIDLGVASADYDSRNFTIGALGATLSVSQVGGFWDLVAGFGALANPSSLTLTGSGGGEIDMAITGAGSLMKNGSGIWYLTGLNTYSGTTVINGGMLNLIGSAATLGSGSSAVILANVAGATLETFWWNGTTNIGTSFSIGSLAGGGAIGGNIVLGQTATMTVGTDNTSTAYGGVISNLWGPANVTKAGAGTLTVTGTSTYSGVTTVNAGTLCVNGQLGNSAMTVSSGATVSGTGTIPGTVTVNNGGNVAPGDGSGTGGKLTFSGALTLLAGSNLNFDLGSAGVSDSIRLTGLYTAPTGTVAINVASRAGFGFGTYSLITGATGISAASFVLNSVPVGYNCTLSASNGTLLFTVAPSPAITSGSSATAIVGNAFVYQITASNTPTGFGAVNLPPGLGVNPGTGLISGTPTATGIYSSTISATNAAGTGSASLTIAVLLSVPQTPSITSALSATGTNGSAFNYQITASNSPTGFGAANLPAGLALNAGTGLINGTPTVTGTFSSTLSAINLGGTGSATLAIVVLPPPPTINSALNATGTNGSAFNYQITASNSPTGFGAANLAAGLACNAGTGLISGTPTTTGTYTSTLSATNAGGTGRSALAIVVLPSPPAAPTGLTATGTSAAVSLGWAASSGASSYVVKRSITSGSGYTAIAAGVTVTAYVDNSVSNGTTYYYVISAVNAGGGSPNSSQASAMPATPSSLPYPWAKADVGTVGTTGTSIYEGGSTFIVKGSGGAIGGTADSFQFAYVTTTSTSFSVIARVTTPLSPSTTKLGVIVRADASNAGAKMAGVLLQMNGSSYQALFASRTSTGGNMKSSSALTGLSLPQWVKVTRAGSTYTGYVSNDGATWITVSSTSATIIGNGNTACCGLAVCSGNTGSLATETFDNVSAPGWTAPPGTPSGLTAAAVSQTQMSLSWNAVSGATAYQVLRSASWSGTYTQSGTTAATTFSDTGLSAGTAYYYMVRATSSSGTSGSSLVAAGVTLPAAPTSLIATGSNAVVALTWVAANGATSYNVKRTQTSGTGYSPVTSGITGTTCLDTAAINGTTYYYVVSAVNAGGEGVNSTEASGTPVAPPVITSATSATGTNGSAFTFQIAASNNPASYGATGLPAGLTVNGGTGFISGTPTVDGTCSATITANNAGGPGGATLIITILATPWGQWQALHFSTAQLGDPTISGDSAAPVGDDISNLIKYALGLDPWTSTVLPIVTEIETLNGNRYLRLTVTRKAKPADVTAEAEVTGDLSAGNWSAADTVIETDTPTTLVVRDGIPANSVTKRFIRLKVARP